VHFLSLPCFFSLASCIIHPSFLFILSPQLRFPCPCCVTFLSLAYHHHSPISPTHATTHASTSHPIILLFRSSSFSPPPFYRTSFYDTQCLTNFQCDDYRVENWVVKVTEGPSLDSGSYGTMRSSVAATIDSCPGFIVIAQSTSLPSHASFVFLFAGGECGCAQRPRLAFLFYLTTARWLLNIER
jgi:hypothetical protein